MAGYSPLKISGFQTGLVQNREEFLLPDDAYPKLQNAYVWRERILRKQGCRLIGRLQRSKPVTGNLTAGAFNLISGLSLEATSSITPGGINIIGGTDGTTYTDPAMNGTLLATGGTGTGGTINYATGDLVITAGGNQPITGTIQYYPGLPVMGIRTQELQNSEFDNTIFFDQVYAYEFNFGSNQFQEFIPGTTWNAHNGSVSATDFFWSTNYWVSSLTVPKQVPPALPTPPTPLFTTNNVKLFWETNNTGQFLGNADPVRITDGTSWINFFQTGTNLNWSQIDAGPTYLTNFLSMLPFRGRLVTFNTWEGATAAGSINYSNRIRWSTIGSPFIPYYNVGGTIKANQGSWRSDIRGQGGFLDIPTSEDIVAVGFVRDNLVIYCERSTWQLRYTGRSIAPFQIERVNSELGASGPFSGVQFDTSLVGIGDKGIVECDSYKSERIDIKIPDYVFNFQSSKNGVITNNPSARIQGIRDFESRLAYWTISISSAYDGVLGQNARIFPNQRLVYNYENDSWALFDDSFTCLGTIQEQSNKTWKNTKIPWIRCNFSWISKPAETPIIIAGNQQGFVEELSSEELTTNDPTLSISAITANTTTSTVITSANHNLTSGTIISISGIPAGTPFANTLNNPQIGVITAATQALPCQITSANHNLSNGAQIEIADVIGMTQLNNQIVTITVVDANNFTLNGIDSTAYTPYSSGGIWTNQANNVFGILLGPDAQNQFQLYKYNPADKKFSTPQLDVPTTAYIGGGLISVIDNFSITSKKFNFLDEGQNIQLGYLDILMASSSNPNPGAISLNVYLDYDDINVSNSSPQNALNNDAAPSQPDPFFNVSIPTTQSSLSNVKGTKFWQRVFCPTRANFITLEYTFSNEQMSTTECLNPVQIDAQVLWIRRGGRMTTI